MLAQVREILERLEEPGSDQEVEVAAEEAGEPHGAFGSDGAADSARPARVYETAPLLEAAENTQRLVVAGATVPVLGALAPPPGSGFDVAQGGARARERLRLARVVLEAGFPADAARAAYEALARAIAALLREPPQPGHAALVAAVYRELLPAGRLPAGAHAALAMLHDLSLLDAQGVTIDAELATRAVEEAEQWIARLSAPSEHTHSSNGQVPSAAREGGDDLRSGA
jgi:hypothetical protein